jgi:predicted membrane chloride channel (bestrophin family)
MGSLFSNEEKEHSFNELTKIEADRDQVRVRAYEKGLSLLFHWKGTIIRQVLLSYEIWLSLGVYAAVKYLLETDKLAATDVPLSYLGIVGGFISFLLVFFIKECYGRYMDQFSRLASVCGRVFDVGCMGSACMPKPRIQCLLRYMCVTMMVGVTAMSDTYNTGNLLFPVIDQYKLLSEEEKEFLQSLDVDNNGGVAFKAMCLWCMRVISEARKANEISDMEKSNFDNQILRFRATFGDLFDYREVTVPFIYVNWVQIMNIIYCPLFAGAVAISSNGLDAEEVGILVVVLNNLFINGLYMLARIFQDPFGSDMEDLSVVDCVLGCVKASYNFINAPNPGDVADQEENELLIDPYKISRLFVH